jgi:hypothetical protein
MAIRSGIAIAKMLEIVRIPRFFMQFLYRIFAGLLALVFSLSLAADTNKSTPKPGAQKFQAILVWATDGEKPAEKEEELKSLEPELRAKIPKFLKWKNYFQVGDRKHVTINGGETKEVQLSHKCNLKLRLSEKEGLQVELIGDGKPVVKKNQTMPLKDDVLIIGGDDKDATAWMVVLKPE